MKKIFLVFTIIMLTSLLSNHNTNPVSAKCLDPFSDASSLQIFTELGNEMQLNEFHFDDFIIENLVSENTIEKEYDILPSSPNDNITVIEPIIIPDCSGGGGGSIGGSSGFGSLNTTKIPSLTKVQILRALPSSWQRHSDPLYRFIEVRYNNVTRLKIHPPDKVTNYHHVHIYNSNGQPLNKYGRVVDYRSKEAHIPYLR